MEQYTQSNNIYNHIATSNLHYDESISIQQSWEEEAFADDIRQGHVGGSIWPQKCYTCNFCDRDFKSAQALGGHMNVHRRDRARLNQPLILKTGLADSSSKTSDVLAYNSYYSNNNDSFRIIGGDMVTNKAACMQECYVETSLNFSGTRNQAAEHVGDHGYKRRRTANASPVPFVYIDCENDIDLELRLGGSTLNKLT